MPETVDPRYRDLDAWTTPEVARAIWEGQLAAAAAVGPALPVISRAVDAAAERLARGSGRLLYAGAGTSARIAVQDGTELAPTFDWPEERTAFLVAGGSDALIRSVEGAEDDADDARRQVAEAGLGADDVLIGLAASGRTPFTLAALESARAAGAYTIGVSNSASAALLTTCDAPILVDTGAEVVAGSTRMKAGTAQKVVLNMISTALMIRLGRVYRGLMVDMRPLNDKLRARAVDMVARLAACPPDAALAALDTAGWNIKRAVLIAGGTSPEDATQRLAASGGNLRTALGESA
ncbi:N-acetylmuramic acid 6-phosphate etherase [Rubellimicrobium mesophilum DSM 19309]|uniref:N-acetylmuramic acid 6-phosphate etherase n=1 Tax=Rubellimicrobium mesophilum DSM 19309 TaxID=442562 RepID=A0A017HQV3_9RHOB|nr:N-acetylmuramic acid 6-phosphate etherase [Rubellimicrobium mesophilum]EYD76700.1 N-acetylmuramic acid 6-phosphate etherase [Rubellimicrobium mesophilum DSM 19309]